MVLLNAKNEIVLLVRSAEYSDQAIETSRKQHLFISGDEFVVAIRWTGG